MKAILKVDLAEFAFFERLPINRIVFTTNIHRLPAWGCRLLLRALGVTYEVRGLENIQKNHGTVVVINHQSAIDLTGKHKSVHKLNLIRLVAVCIFLHSCSHKNYTESWIFTKFRQYFSCLLAARCFDG